MGISPWESPESDTESHSMWFTDRIPMLKSSPVMSNDSFSALANALAHERETYENDLIGAEKLTSEMLRVSSNMKEIRSNLRSRTLSVEQQELEMDKLRGSMDQLFQLRAQLASL